MEDHAYSFFCKEKIWQRCDDENLEVVKILNETYNADGDLTEKVCICRCRACNGFYKRKYRATYYPSHLFDTEEGWDVSDKYFRIEEPLWKTLHSTLDVPLMIQEARSYGFAGEDHSWKNGRCNFPAQNVELTCRAADLQFVAYFKPEARDHTSAKIYRCRRCGEWYFFKILPPYTEALLKRSNALFPADAARFHGDRADDVSSPVNG